MKDCIIIGCGFAGATAARQLAEAGWRALILEQRDHIGGNAYDEEDEYGVLVHKYGPHIFHTEKKRVYEYLSRFTDWYAYSHEVVGKVGDKLLPIPFNLNTLGMVYGEKKAKELREILEAEYGTEVKVPILKLRKHSRQEIKELADYVYQNVFLKYTMKQWGRTPEEIDPAISGRVPVFLSWDNRYFQDTWQGMPRDGYTPLFKKLLAHTGIEVRLSCPAASVLSFDKEAGKIYFEGKEYTGTMIYTGAIDELFDCCYGKLPYRSLDFAFEHYPEKFYQSHGVVNYTVSEEYTRITEFKRLTGQACEGTTIIKEYPRSYTGGKGQIPYYAIQNPENQALYEKYCELAGRFPHMHMLGRLAEYKYYNIDAIVDRALELAESISREGV
ncbi:UDP-galactopyranose mutase [Acetivibrio ethanolgignens]|uniref:UDP-galactopyranose mutase n=1 Tax=Acetivibrio ethanolgignens TaxID=290052 RepID=A0A0V8QB60_9FIRM|nr:UDP-galactopyranose mutase [Acetivibrio ethanolgignens]KSV57829.1 UDP-galactopyranose mutase [Acetivibrio ethanolgignens]